MVPREIFDLMKATNINLYKTCKMFYYHVDAFYKIYAFNCLTNLSMHQSNFTIHRILSIPVEKQSEEMRSYINNQYRKIRF